MTALKTTCMLVVAIFFMSGAVFPADKATDDTVKREKFSFKVPAGWSMIPQKDIDAIYQSQKEVAVRAKRDIPVMDCGLRLDLSKDYPRILVAINTAGQMSEDMFRQVGAIEWKTGADKGAKQADDLAPQIASVKVGEWKYDRKKRIIWARTDAQVDGFGSVKGISALELTATGYILIGYMAEEKDFEKHLATFLSFVYSFALDKSIEYKAGKSQ